MQNKFKNIILLGEMHGTEGNLWALQKLIDEVGVEYSNITVALELSTDWNGALSKLDERDTAELLELIQGTDELLSGRISNTHIGAYVKLAQQGMHFVAIRDDKDDWNGTDKTMAENILKASEGSDIVIATIGNFHISKESFVASWLEEHYVCHPVGEILRDDTTSIVIRYGNSEYINFGKISKLNDEKCADARCKVGTMKESVDNNYDYEVCVYGSGIL